VELQVRTIFEEGWSEVDHQTRYPYDQDNPTLLEPLFIFNRLSGSADEFSTYVRDLKHFLVEKNAEIIDRDRKIEELHKVIDRLEIDNANKNLLSTTIDQLRNVSSPPPSP